MAKQEFSRYQQGIVKRYYDNHDTIQSDKLSELVSELWLAEDAKTQTKLWGKAQETLMRMGVDATLVGNVVGKRDMEALAKLVQQIDAGKTPTPAPGIQSTPAPGIQSTPAPGSQSAAAGKQNAPGVVSRSGVNSGATSGGSSGGGGGGHKGTPPSDGSAIKAAGARSMADQPGGNRTIAQMRDQANAAAGTDSLDDANLKRALKAFRRKMKNYKRDDESRLGAKFVTAGRASGISAITPPKEFPMAVWNKLVELGRLKPAGGGTYELP